MRLVPRCGREAAGEGVLREAQVLQQHQAPELRGDRARQAVRGEVQLAERRQAPEPVQEVSLMLRRAFRWVKWLLLGIVSLAF